MSFGPPGKTSTSRAGLAAWYGSCACTTSRVWKGATGDSSWVKDTLL